MHLAVNIIEQKLVCTFGERPPVHVTLTDTLIAELQACCDRYHDLQRSDDPAALLAIGQALFAVINTQPAETRLWLSATGSRRLTVLAEANPTLEQQLLLHLPWEILAENNQFLTADVVPFEVTRQVGEPSQDPLQPRYKDLTLAFMAADPGLNSDLNYEAEERAIFTATRNHRNLNLLVDESGNLEELSRRLYDAGHCDVLHLSCHGSFDAERGFVLHLEDEQFGPMTATAHDFARLRLHEQFSTLFLSACHSANNRDKHSLMIDLARLGIANIVGWDGAVADEDATVFAEYFYQALQRQATVPDACARARQALLEKGYGHWHLGRCCISAQGGEPLVSRRKPKSQRRKGKPCHELLDKEKQEVRVASRETFVGRRRQTKEALRVFAERDYAGVLLYAIGGSGKSSLAARIADRLEPTFKAAVLYRNYQPFDVLQTLGAAARGIKEKNDFLELIAFVQSRPDSFKDILIELLEGVFDQQPILLVLDDLEQHVLEELSGERKEAEVKLEYQATLIAIIEAFDEADTESRLLLTSRYKFVVQNRFGVDVAARLKAIKVPDMTETELKMHWLVLQETAQGEREEGEQDSRYLQRIYDAGKGNPGLQHLLFQPLLKGETVALDRALERIGDYRATQTEQSDSSADDLDKYLQRIALEVYSRALNDTELQLLRLLTLFDFPVPEELLLQAGPKIGIAAPCAALQRLDNFGLVNHWSEKGLEEHVSCYGLAEKVVEPLGREDRNYLAQVCAPLLWRIWFRDFLEEYAVPETETLRESVKFIIANYFPNKYAEKLPLSGETDQRRIAALHRLCIRNSLVNWEELDFDMNTFIKSLELTITLHVFEKLSLSDESLRVFSGLQFTKLYKILDNEREKFQKMAKEDPHVLLILMSRRFGRGKLFREAYLLFFGNPNRELEEIIKEIENKEDNRNYLEAALCLSRTDKQKGIAYVQYAQSLFDRKEDHETAEAMLLKAMKIYPRSADVMGNYAVFLEEKKEDYAAAEAMYERAVEAASNHALNLGNYAGFLSDQKQDYVAAEAMYELAVEVDPKYAYNLGRYAFFLRQQKKDYAAAEAMYERAVEADPNHARNLAGYAIFLDVYKKDYTAAEKMYQRAVEAAPENANCLGNYARLLFLRGDKTKAIEMLEQAEQHQEKNSPDLPVELAFYRYAHCQPQSINPLKKLLLDGTRSLGWNLKDNVHRAEQDGHPNPALLAALAKVISDDEPLETLEQFEEWRIAEPTT